MGIFFLLIIPVFIIPIIENNQLDKKLVSLCDATSKRLPHISLHYRSFHRGFYYTSLYDEVPDSFSATNPKRVIDVHFRYRDIQAQPVPTIRKVAHVQIHAGESFSMAETLPLALQPRIPQSNWEAFRASSSEIFKRREKWTQSIFYLGILVYCLIALTMAFPIVCGAMLVFAGVVLCPCSCICHRVRYIREMERLCQKLTGDLKPGFSVRYEELKADICAEVMNCNPHEVHCDTGWLSVKYVEAAAAAAAASVVPSSIMIAEPEIVVLGSGSGSGNSSPADSHYIAVCEPEIIVPQDSAEASRLGGRAPEITVEPSCPV